MDAIDLRMFRYGGVNITGFRIVNQASIGAQQVRRDWRQLLANNAWRGAPVIGETISVGCYTNTGNNNIIITEHLILCPKMQANSKAHAFFLPIIVSTEIDEFSAFS